MTLSAALLGFGAGLLAGGMYLAGLWLTVRRAARTGNRGLLLVSFVVRAALLLLAFYLLLGLGALGLGGALLGFLVARMLLTRLLARGKGANDDPVS